MLEEIAALVFKHLNGEKSGHGADHIKRVYGLCLRFSDLEPGADREVVGLAALLHDVDDYKLVGKVGAKKLANANYFMEIAGTPLKTREKVLEIISTMGYSRFLQGIRPKTLEGKIVSDGDMCDALGANGIIRTIIYGVSGKSSGIIFDRKIFPREEIDYETYTVSQQKETAINHFFEKLLKLPELMLTPGGKEEAFRRRRLVYDFLEQFFKEEDAGEWLGYLQKVKDGTNG